MAQNRQAFFKEVLLNSMDFLMKAIWQRIANAVCGCVVSTMMACAIWVIAVAIAAIAALRSDGGTRLGGGLGPSGEAGP